MRSMYKLKWCICSDNRCKTIPNELYENRGSRCKWQCTLFTIFNIVPSFYRIKKILRDFKNPKHFNFRSFIKIMLKEKNKVYSSRIRTVRSFLLSFLLLFVAMPHNDIYLLIWSHYGK